MAQARWLFDLEGELRRRREEGDLDPAWEARAEEVLAVAPGARYVGFDPECIGGPADYVEILAALSELARPSVELGPFRVRGAQDALRFHGTIAGEEVTFTRPPITTDWFDADVLVELNGALAARGIDGAFTTVELSDGYEIFFLGFGAQRSLALAPALVVEHATALPDGAPTSLRLPALRAVPSLFALGVTRHPVDPQFAFRLATPDGTSAVLAGADGEVWFAPEDARDIVWSIDGATTWVLSDTGLAGWVWGEDAIRAEWVAGARPPWRVFPSPCGRFVAVVARNATSWELVLLDARDLRVVAKAEGPEVPAAFGFRDDGGLAAMLIMDRVPMEMGTEIGPQVLVGVFRGLEAATGDEPSVTWRMDPAAFAHGRPALPDELVPLRLEGAVAAVELPGWGEVRETLID